MGFPQLEDIQRAQERIRPHLPPTPMEEANMLPEGHWLKLENMNRTHSFKVRGALNAMLALDEDVRARGVIAASTGNHAQGMAYAAKLLGVKATIIMPETAARRKVAGVKRLGAEAVLTGETYDDAEAEAHRLEALHGLTYISAYNNFNVIAGQGTVGLEILHALPTVRRVLVPIGGGGLVSGVAIALKAHDPSIEVIGVNALVSPEMYNIMYELDHVTGGESLADALPGLIEHESMTIEIVSRTVDRIVLVSEDDIARAMRSMVVDQGWIAEGGGVVGLAALQNGTIDAHEPADGPTVVVISGGNVDADRLRRVLCG
ncbi:MAG: threonine/serine dehydratase [Pleurocapsa minor GSE-CHR-MK-17-07R]|jgi:threonine dehydratase|nr:threonine/serine dehydratase [Pleurocapsa minor GSE-CHR-MK 17-07R]